MEFLIKHAQDPGKAGLSLPDLRNNQPTNQPTNHPSLILVVILGQSVHVINLFAQFIMKSVLVNGQRKTKSGYGKSY